MAYGDRFKAHSVTMEELKAMHDALTDPDKRAEVLRKMKRKQRIEAKRRDTGL